MKKHANLTRGFLQERKRKQKMSDQDRKPAWQIAVDGLFGYIAMVLRGEYDPTDQGRDYDERPYKPSSDEFFMSLIRNMSIPPSEAQEAINFIEPRLTKAQKEPQKLKLQIDSLETLLAYARRQLEKA